MRHAIRVQIVETEGMISALPLERDRNWTREISYFVLALASFGALLVLLVMTGCGSKSQGGGYLGKVAQSAAVQMSTVTGDVRQGATAVSGARVYLLESTGEGEPESLLSAAVEGASVDSQHGLYAVTADALGRFTLRGGLSCTSGATVYVYAVQGGSALTRVLGVCPAAETWNVAGGVRVDVVATAAQSF